MDKQPTQEGGKLQDPLKSKIWHRLPENVRERLLELCSRLERGEPIWNSYIIAPDVDKVQLTAILLEDLYMGAYISNELIDWYLLWELKQNKSADKIGCQSQWQNFVSLRSNSYTRYVSDDEAMSIFAQFEIQEYLKRTLKTTTEKLFVPILSSKYHWTLLYFDLELLKWHHYNSVKGTAPFRKKHMATAEKFKTYLTSVLAPMITDIRGVQQNDVIIEEDIIVEEGPIQNNACDCGLYVCNFIKHVLMVNYQKWTAEEIYHMRREWIRTLLFTPGESWDPVSWTKDVFTYSYDKLPGTGVDADDAAPSEP